MTTRALCLSVCFVLAACGSKDNTQGPAGGDGSTTTKPDGSTTKPDGSMTTPDGSMTTPDGGVADSGLRDAVAQPPDVGCLPPTIDCGGSCINPLTSPEHCGGCSRACAATESCKQGSCFAIGDCRQAGATCPDGYFCDLGAGQCKEGCNDNAQCGPLATCDLAAHRCQCVAGAHRCGDVCKDSKSTDHCGTACAPCPSVSHGKPTCDGKACGVACDGGYHLCGGSCAANNSPQHCGASCSPCPSVPHGKPTCDGASCGIACDPGYHLCNGSCVADNDVAHCGGGCSPCATVANGKPSCDGKACGVACDAGYHLCGGACVAKDDVAHCGSSCTPCPAPTQNGVATCDGTSCGVSCDADHHACGTECESDLSIDSCGTACTPCPIAPSGATATCDGVACGVQCKAALDPCGGSCVALLDDKAHCGSCGVACQSGETCERGRCMQSCYWGGTFGTPQTLTALVADGEDLVAGDFNGDGKDDIAIATEGQYYDDEPGHVVVLLSSGGGAFAGAVAYPVGLAGSACPQGNPGKLVAGDFNGDGKLDLAAADRTSSADRCLALLLGNGDGTFSVSWRASLASGVGDLATGDFDGDGVDDLLVAGCSSTSKIYYGASSAPLSGQPTSIITKGDACRVAAGDLDGDHKDDAVLYYSSKNKGGYYWESFAVDLGADGTVDHDELAGYTGFTELEVFDRDGDGDNDVVFRDPLLNAAYFFTYKNDGSGTVFTQTHLTVKPEGAQGMAFIDFGSGDQRLITLMPDGSGGEEIWIYKTSTSIAKVPTAHDGDFVIADIDGDGHWDIAILDSNGDFTVQLGSCG